MIDQKAMEGGRIRAHSIHIDERQLMRVSGVKDVDSFNEQEVQLLTEAGALRIEGMGLHMTKLDLDAGQVILEGEIIALERKITASVQDIFGITLVPEVEHV